MPIITYTHMLVITCAGYHFSNLPINSYHIYICRLSVIIHAVIIHAVTSYHLCQLSCLPVILHASLLHMLVITCASCWLSHVLVISNHTYQLSYLLPCRLSVTTLRVIGYGLAGYRLRPCGLAVTTLRVIGYGLACYQLWPCGLSVTALRVIGYDLAG